MTFDPTMLVPILPMILLGVLGLLVLILDLVLPLESRKSLGWVTAGGLFLVVIPSLLIAAPKSDPELTWGGLIKFDSLAVVFSLIFFVGAAITAIFTMDYQHLGKRGELYVLLIASTIGMALMAASADLIMLFLAIEMTSIPLYVLAGMRTKDEKSVESGYKYLIFGAMASAVMLYGFSLLYGFTGTTNIYSLAAAFDEGQLSNIPVIGSLIIILVGFGFKISAVPFHFWAPDVYEGAPTPVAGFLSTASKAAGFAVLVRVFLAAYPDFSFEWSAILAVIAVATMTLGNLIALAQKNIKRLLAYSSIAHAGYILLGIVVANEFGIASSIYYLLAYLVTNLAAFGTVGVYGRAIGSDEIAAYAGMSRRAPALALVLMVSMLSLAGMPPLGGFIAKVFVFAAVVRVDVIWLAVIGILNSIIGLYYYLVVLKVVYLYRSEDEDKPLAISRSAKFALVMLTIAIILLGTVFSPWYNLATSAAAAMF